MFKAWSYFQGHLLLYGANAFNGILFMTSQSPFTSQGITAFWTNKSKAAGTNDYVDYGIRMAHAFSPNLPQS
jgi:hypothetical protein